MLQLSTEWLWYSKVVYKIRYNFLFYRNEKRNWIIYLELVFGSCKECKLSRIILLS